MAMENGIEGDIDHEEGSQQSSINISDVIEVIGPEMFSVSQPGTSRRNVHVKIVEQPASKALRFRYECEGRSAGSIPGIHSTPENKSFPTIEVVGYKGRAVVVVSCVTKDEPHRPHPHNLVGKDGCRKGVCTVEINAQSMMCVSFSNLGIQCVKKKDIDEALRVREEIRVDPYKTGFSHRSQPTSIDLNAVRLCFQVFIEGPEKGRFTVPLKPVVSDIIYDKKAMSDLVICKMSHCSASVAGGREVILLCEKVAKEDISVRFYEELNGLIVWEGLGDFQHANVHKQVAIAFRTPRYRTLDVEQPIKVYIQLRRPSDGAISEPLPFELLPLDSDPVELKRKRQKFSGDQNIHLLRQLQAPVQDIASRDQLAQPPMYNAYEMSPEHSIKTEPKDQTPSPYGGPSLVQYEMYRTVQGSPSPQHHATPSPPLDYAAGGAWSRPPMPPLPPAPTNISMPPETLNSLLDMDSHQFTQLNSAELSTLLEEENFHPQSRVHNMEQEYMTDSFTRLTTRALEEITRGNELPDDHYRPN